MKNSAGQTPFDVLINSDKDFKYATQISNASDLAAYVKECSLLFGAEFLKRIGGKLVLKALAFRNKSGLELASLFIKERGI